MSRDKILKFLIIIITLILILIIILSCVLTIIILSSMSSEQGYLISKIYMTAHIKPINGTNNLFENQTITIKYLQSEGYNVTKSGGAPRGLLAKKENNTDFWFIFISTDISEPYISCQYASLFRSTLLDTRKELIKNEVNNIADVANVTVDWENASWSVIPADTFIDYVSVEEFLHWVWIYDVDENDNNGNNIPDTTDSLGQPYSIVKFTYTHPRNSNLFDVENPEWWPVLYYLNNKRFNIYLPWFSNYTQRNGKYISTTKLIWYGHAFDYDPTEDPYPTAVTRYYDASP